MTCLISQAHANRVRLSIRNQGIGRGHAVQDGSRVFGNFHRREAHSRGNRRIDLEVRRGTADGIVDSILNVHDAANLADGIPDARAQIRQQRGIAGEDLDLDRLRRVR